MHEKGSITPPTLIGPGSFYVTGEDNLRMIVRNAATGVICTLEGRFLNLAGVVMPFVHVLTPTTNRAASTLDARLGDGWILNATIRVTTGTPQIGQTFAQLRVIRGIGAAPIAIGTLLQGYVTESDDLAWPGSPIRNSLEGPGAIVQFAVSNPGAGLNFTLTVPTGVRWQIQTLLFVFTTSADVANREVALVVIGGAGSIAGVFSGFVHTASEARTYTFYPGAQSASGEIRLANSGSFPLVLFRAGDQIISAVEGIVAADAITNIIFNVIEWHEP